MNQAGGTIVDGDEITADSAENVEGLEYVRSLYDAGVLRFPSEIDAGWGGEALGAGKAAMVIEGPWIKGIAGDFPDTNYAAYELPAGPGGPSTYSFTNCWGLPQGADTTDAAVEFVEFLTSDEQQVEFGDAFGVIPSTREAAATYAENHPENAAVVAGADYAVSPANFDGSAAVVAEFNARLADFGNADFAAILADFQAQLEAAYAEANG
jgi:multiple sugar transport system substrate-binding protein